MNDEVTWDALARHSACAHAIAYACMRRDLVELRAMSATDQRAYAAHRSAIAHPTSPMCSPCSTAGDAGVDAIVAAAAPVAVRLTAAEALSRDNVVRRFLARSPSAFDLPIGEAASNAAETFDAAAPLRRSNDTACEIDDAMSSSRSVSRVSSSSAAAGDEQSGASLDSDSDVSGSRNGYGLEREPHQPHRHGAAHTSSSSDSFLIMADQQRDAIDAVSAPTYIFAAPNVYDVAATVTAVAIGYVVPRRRRRHGVASQPCSVVGTATGAVLLLSLMLDAATTRASTTQGDFVGQHDGAVIVAQWARGGGDVFATAGADAVVVIWSALRRVKLRQIPVQFPPTAMAFHPTNANVVFVGLQERADVRACNLSTGIVSKVMRSKSAVLAVATDRCGRFGFACELDGGASTATIFAFDISMRGAAAPAGGDQCRICATVVLSNVTAVVRLSAVEIDRHRTSSAATAALAVPRTEPHCAVMMCGWRGGNPLFVFVVLHAAAATTDRSQQQQDGVAPSSCFEVVHAFSFDVISPPYASLSQRGCAVLCGCQWDGAHGRIMIAILPNKQGAPAVFRISAARIDCSPLGFHWPPVTKTDDAGDIMLCVDCDIRHGQPPRRAARESATVAGDTASTASALLVVGTSRGRVCAFKQLDLSDACWAAATAAASARHHVQASAVDAASDDEAPASSLAAKDMFY